MYAQILLWAALPALLAGFMMTWILKFVAEYRGREFLEPHKWGTIFGLWVLFEILNISTTTLTGWRYVYYITVDPLWAGWGFYLIGSMVRTIASRLLLKATTLATRAREFREDVQFHRNLENGGDAE
jgi:hypothetical protein